MSTVLVIDDEEEVAKAIARALRYVVSSEWTIRHTTSALDGRDKLVSDEAIRVAFVDILMPELNGVELIASTLEQRPQLRGHIVVCSGAPLTPQQERRLFAELGCLWLDKPVDAEALGRMFWVAVGT